MGWDSAKDGASPASAACVLDCCTCLARVAGERCAGGTVALAVAGVVAGVVASTAWVGVLVLGVLAGRCLCPGEAAASWADISADVLKAAAARAPMATIKTPTGSRDTRRTRLVVGSIVRLSGVAWFRHSAMARHLHGRLWTRLQAANSATGGIPAPCLCLGGAHTPALGELLPALVTAACEVPRIADYVSAMPQAPPPRADDPAAVRHGGWRLARLHWGGWAAAAE